jgi:transcriptional regulator with XRE-family HTH domain
MTAVDKHIGRRIRGKRRALGLSERDLASALGVDDGRLRDYELGTEHVPSEQIILLGEIMSVPLSYFFPATP